MAITVSHAMRRYSATPPDSKYNNYSPIRTEDTSLPLAHWSSHHSSVVSDHSASTPPPGGGSGSALSRSMRYAEPWLYGGSVRGAPAVLLATAGYPGPHQLHHHHHHHSLLQLCSCSEYVQGTASRSKKKGPTLCKKCKGTRLPIGQPGGTVRAKYGTVRGYSTSTPAPTLSSIRAGTVRVTTSTSRPSILPPSSNSNTSVDPYDLMRRSRLSCPDIGSQFRARSSSPSKSRNNYSSVRQQTRPHSPSPPKIGGRKSILECDVNPYELMDADSKTKTTGEKRKGFKNLDLEYEDVDIGVTNKKSHIPKLQQNKKIQKVKVDKDTVTPAADPKFKSILKKPSTFNEGEGGGAYVDSITIKSGSHFYLPLPSSTNAGVVSPRKKVQFLVENENNDRKDVVVVFDPLLSMNKETPLQEHNDEGTVDLDCREIVENVEKETRSVEDIEQDLEPCRLKRSLSERLGHELPTVSFNDTMALRTPRGRGVISDRSTTLFEAVTDLQRLDGIGPARPRPREPPPPPPPPSQENDRPATPPPRSQTELESGYDVAMIKELQELKEETIKLKNELAKKKFEEETSRVNKEKTHLENKRKLSNHLPIVHIQETRKTSLPEDLMVNCLNHKNSMEETKKLIKPQEELKKTDQQDTKKTILQSETKQDESYEDTPPAAPPRKRSNSKQPITTQITSKKEEIKSNKNTSTKSTENDTKLSDEYSDSSIEEEKPDIKVTLKTTTETEAISPKITIKSTATNDNISSTRIETPESNYQYQKFKVEPSKTIVQITSPVVQVIPSTVHRLQIKNEFTETINYNSINFMDNPQRKTSIMINGDDCYSTVNVNDDIPIYQSSVVVNDYDSSIEINSGNRSSSVYITGDFQPSTPLTSRTSEERPKKTLVILDGSNLSYPSTPQNSPQPNGDTTPDIGKTFVALPEQQTPVETKVIDDKPSSEELQRLLKDPVEAVKRNLVPHVCGKADVERKSTQKKQITSNSLVARLLEDPFLGSLAEGLETNTVAKLIEDSLLKLRGQDFQDEDKDACSEEPYELIEVGSDCYSNHSNRSSVTEDELGTRSKFYQLLADSALSEVEEHHYECIRPNVDPIYEEIEIPPPLPSNPPPSSIIDDLQIDKQFTTRSIFEGASKYDILSYLVDAKERGIVPEEGYTYNFTNSGDVIVEEEDESKRGVFSSRVSHMSTVSDSSEDSSLVITSEKNGPQKSAEVERNDSGVGSETSKCSRSRYLTQPEPSTACEDCDLVVDPQPEDGPLICRKCSKKRSERKEIITEIVETEEKYSRDLQIILEEFYQPMLVAGLLTPEQLSAIFLNVEELLENSQALAERLRDTLEIALEQGDEDLLTVNIGKIFLEAAPMLHAFESYCVRQGPASLLLAGLEKDKELLRIFLRVSQMENTVLRRMNLNSFLMVPVQRVTKYPLLLARLHKVTPLHHESRDLLRESQHKIELHLSHMNSETKDVPSKLWRRISSGSGRRSSSEMDLVNIKLRKIAVDVLEWNHDEARFALEGRLLYTQPTDNNWRKGRTIKLSHVNALLVTNGKPNNVNIKNDREENALTFPRHTGVREAALLLVRDKGGRYSLLREPLYLDRCVIATDPAWQSYFEVQELLGKDTFIFKAEDAEMTRTWYRQLQYHAQGMGAWRKRRNALANIMINGMGSRS